MKTKKLYSVQVGGGVWNFAANEEELLRFIEKMNENRVKFQIFSASDVQSSCASFEDEEKAQNEMFNKD